MSAAYVLKLYLQEPKGKVRPGVVASETRTQARDRTMGLRKRFPTSRAGTVRSTRIGVNVNQSINEVNCRNLAISLIVEGIHRFVPRPRTVESAMSKASLAEPQRTANQGISQREPWTAKIFARPSAKRKKMKQNSPTAGNGLHSPNTSVGRITNTCTLFQGQLRNDCCRYRIIKGRPNGVGYER